MNKENILTEVKAIYNKNIILEIATGGGKTLCAIHHIERALYDYSYLTKVLIVVPKLAIKKNWIEELAKWNKTDLLQYIEFSTYVSLPKNYDKEWCLVCFDEAHHITERCLRSIENSLNRTGIRHLFLSATLSIAFKIILNRIFPDLFIYTLTLKEAIENEILPEPTILLYPMILDNSQQKYVYIKRKSGIPTKVPYEKRWPVIKNNTLSPHILCTELQYHNLLCDDIKFLNSKPKLKSILQQKRIQRLKALSDFKTKRMANILSLLKDYRVITFCNSIEQTEKLGKNCIHSKNDNRFLILDDFNAKKIKHITSCDMLSEGMNVTDCRIGLFARINASDVQIKQKLGRILRHKKPIVIIPYFVNTREEEIVNKEILPSFNEEKIFTIHGINEILQYLK